MSQVTVQIGRYALQLNDLGAEMNEQFRIFYQTNLTPNDGSFLVPSVLNFSTDFRTRSFDFFDTNGSNHNAIDRYFSNFSIIWEYFLQHGIYEAAQRLWNDVLSFVFEWENRRSRRVHKGTPFYWMGGTAILNGELSKGFLLIHQAMDEDNRSFGTAAGSPRTPAFFFITLDYGEVAQYFGPLLLRMSEFIDHRLGIYRSSRTTRLQLGDFKSRFLEQTATLKDVIFHFVYTIFQVKQLLTDIDQKWRQNVFSSLLETGILFDLCLVIESIIKNKDTTQYRPRQIPYFSDRIVFLSQSSRLSLDSRKLAQIGDGAKADFANTLRNLLNSNYRLPSGSTLSQIEEDLAIAYVFRNFGAHTLEGHQVIYESFEELTQRILNALFFSVENLY